MTHLPRILIIDDLFGRTHSDRRNEERANLCGQYLLEDVTGDEKGKGGTLKIKQPVAQVFFFRGQNPACSTVGDTVESDLEATLTVIREGWGEPRPENPCWSMVLLDLCFYTGPVTKQSERRALGMPEGRERDNQPKHYFGLEILEAIHKEFPDLPVVIMSSMPRKNVSREFSSKGALGFLPREDAHSADRLKEMLWRHGLIQDETGEIVGRSRSLLMALRAARRAASARRNVLIRGERGVGKELLARYIWRHGSKSASTPFLAVNSAVLSPTLFASELFGIENRVATGVEGRGGLIPAASGGDLFLDEIRDMSPEAQAGILRVLEDRKVTPVGAKASIPVDVRFLSATNADVEELASTGRFRPDLLDRLREGGTAFLPPLNERRSDIPLLVEKLVREAEAKNTAAIHRDIGADAMEKLCAYDWPGNVRELRNCIFEAVNSNPDVEHLVVTHIRVPTIRQSATAQQPGKAARFQSPRNLEDLLRMLDSVPADAWSASEIAGKLPAIRGACDQLTAKLVKAAITATRRPSLDEPEGKILIHPAMKLLTGNRALTASKAADLVKRLLKENASSTSGLLEDPALREAHAIAHRLRPKSQPTMSRANGSKSEGEGTIT
jgi:DNA-binding NtrC family response regulator